MIAPTLLSRRTKWRSFSNDIKYLRSGGQQEQVVICIEMKGNLIHNRGYLLEREEEYIHIYTERTKRYCWPEASKPLAPFC
jgi:hypothetical protein